MARATGSGKRIGALALWLAWLGACGDRIDFVPDDAAAEANSGADLGAIAAQDGQSGDLAAGDGAAGDGGGGDASLGKICGSDDECPKSLTPCVVGRCVAIQGEAAKGHCAFVLADDGSACDDGDACTAEEKCQVGVCTGGSAACGCQSDGDCKDDGNLCNGVLYCDKSGSKGVCKPNPKTVVTCPDAGPCTSVACDPASGKCQTANLAGKCDDGNECTANDTCDNGTCKAGKTICECLKAADCPDDGDLCNGTPYCDTSSFPFVCKPNPATAVTCPTGLDTPCKKHVCEPKSGQCVQKNAADGATCDDGDPCSNGDHCALGTCEAGVNVCACKTNADCAAHEDGDLCNGTLYCDLALTNPGCKINPATVVKCSDGDDTQCSKSTCDPKVGKCQMVALPDTATCSDDNACTQGDHCQTGTCVGAANTCKCTTEAECAPHEDGNLCNGTLYCNKAKQPFVCDINPATVVKCPSGDDTECSKNACNPATGKCAQTKQKDGKPCDDDFVCTQGDACKNGLCAAGTNTCKCETDSGCGQFEDGNLCNGTLYCNKGAAPFVCEVNPKTLIVCKVTNDTECLKNLCAPKTGLCGLTPVHQGQACEADNDKCTTGDSCNLGTCEAGPVTCQCTADSDCAAFDDGDPCNGTLFCDKSKLPFVCGKKPNTAVVCDGAGDTPCQKNLCSAKTGQCAMTVLADNLPCEDGNLCTQGDVCAGGKCLGQSVCACQTDQDCAGFDANLCDGKLVCQSVGGQKICVNDAAPVVCPAPLQPCMKSSCVPATGLCVGEVDLAKDGTACDDGNLCTAASTCKTGVCSGKANGCDDLNPCTDDACAATTGICSHTANQKPCSDGSACTSKDNCANGGCVGAPIVCDDGNPCTNDGCDPPSGCTATASSQACNDNNPCTVNDSCKNLTCSGAAKDCDDKSPCTADSCNPASGKCTYSLLGVTCDDGTQCTTGDTCLAGSCVGVPQNCDDNKPCTVDGCDAFKGCAHALLPDGATCSDGNPCTSSDTCAGGACSGKNGNCNDSNPCTQDSCVAGKGCENTKISTAPCDDGNACTDSDACVNGACTGTAKVCAATCGGAPACEPNFGCPIKASCDDGNPCTNDGCVAGIGCVSVPVTDGLACGGGQMCKAGVCGTCNTLNLLISATGYDVTLRGVVRDAASNTFAFGSQTKLLTSNEDGLMVVVNAAGAVVKQLSQEVLGNDALLATTLAPTGSGIDVYAAGYATNLSNKTLDGWIVGVKSDLSQAFDRKVGTGNDEQFWAVAARGSNGIAAGNNADKAWLYEFNGGNGDKANDTSLSVGTGKNQWRALTALGSPAVVYAAGQMADTTAGTVKSMVAQVGPQLDLSWTKVLAPAKFSGLEALTVTTTTAGPRLAAAGWQSTDNQQFVGWIVLLDPANGDIVSDRVEALAAPRQYLAAAPGGLVTAAFGGQAGGAGKVFLSNFGAMAVWGEAGATPLLSALVAANTTPQILRGATTVEKTWTVVGHTHGQTGEQVGWIVQLGPTGKPACVSP